METPIARIRAATDYQEEDMTGYELEVCIVLDATGSADSYICAMRDDVVRFYDKYVAYQQERYASYGDVLKSLRVQLIDYADFATEGEDAIHKSRFFELPREQEALAAWFDAIEYRNRGGDLPENGLEALYEAIHTDWTPRDKADVRQCRAIILVSDYEPVDLRDRAGCLGYPEGRYPENMTDFEKDWNAFLGIEEDDEDGWDGDLLRNSTNLYLYAPTEEDKAGKWSWVYNWAFVCGIPFGSLVKDGICFDMIVEEIIRY